LETDESIGHDTARSDDPVNELLGNVELLGDDDTTWYLRMLFPLDDNNFNLSNQNETIQTFASTRETTKELQKSIIQAFFFMFDCVLGFMVAWSLNTLFHLLITLDFLRGKYSDFIGSICFAIFVTIYAVLAMGKLSASLELNMIKSDFYRSRANLSLRAFGLLVGWSWEDIFNAFMETFVPGDNHLIMIFFTTLHCSLYNTSSFSNLKTQ